MSTPTELLEKKIRHRQEALRAREAETAAREAELEDLKKSLEKLQSARKGIRAAIEGAMSHEPTSTRSTIAPTDVLEMAVEGAANTAGLFADANDNANITAEEAVCLALVSVRDDLGPEGLVKMVIQAAVEASQLDALGVIKAALETVRTSGLRASDVVWAALRTANSSHHLLASELIPPAVEIALWRGIEPPVIVKQAFVSAVRGDPSMVRTSLLSLLGCAVGMGMSYRDIRSMTHDFSKEIERGETSQDDAADPSKMVRFDASPSPHIPKPMLAEQTQQPQPSNKGGNGDDLNRTVVGAMIDGALESIDNGGPGMPALGAPSVMIKEWPGEYAAASAAVEDILAGNASSVGGSSAKRSVGEDGVEEEAEEQGPASKKAKLSYSREDGGDGCQ